MWFYCTRIKLPLWIEMLAVFLSHAGRRFHLDEVLGAEHRHGVGVLLLLLQQLSRQRLLMQKEALLLNNVCRERLVSTPKNAAGASH